MTIQEFYDKYNLNREYFASIAGVGGKTLSKYAKGEKIREDSKLRIDNAMRIAERYNLVRPEYDQGKALFFGMSYKHEFHRKNCEYVETFKRLIKSES